MWVARGLPRVIKRASDASVVVFSSLGHWKVDASPTDIHMRCMHHKDAPPFPPARLARPTGSTPLACAFLPSDETSRIVVLTPTTLEMYSYVLDFTDGVRLHALESITFGKEGVEEGTCLAVNEDQILVGTTIARIMIFRWAYMGNGGHVIAPLDSINLQPPSAPTTTTFKPPTESVAFRLDHLEVVRQAANSSVVTMEASAGLLAVGAADSTVQLLRLQHPKRRHDASWSRPAAKPMMDDIKLVADDEPVQLSLGLWGYSSDEIGPVSSLAFTEDGRAIAIGYAIRGLSVFSTDGCKLMSTLPQQLGAGSTKTEVARYGVDRVSWSYATSTLVIVPKSQPVVPSKQDEGEARGISLFDIVDVELVKDADGLCLSLAGEPNQSGAWVRSEEPFVPRSSDGRPGPAESSRKIRGGELLLSIDGTPVWQSPFEGIVHQLKEIQVGSTVAMTFLAVSYDHVFSLAVDALTSDTFWKTHQLDWTNDHSIWEYSLRMQALHGDCNETTVPSSLLDFEAHARFNGWAALRDCSKQVALHRYVKLYLSLFPTMAPHEALQMLQPVQEPPCDPSLPPDAPTSQSPPIASIVHLDFARSVLPLDRSDLHLLESQAVVMVSSRSCNDPCGVLSSTTVAVPTTYAQANLPMQHLAVNTANTRVAVAGTRGFAVLNKRTNKWLMFGSELEEQSFRVVALTWWKDDVIVALTSQAQQLFLDAFPRTRLDLESRMAHIAVPDDVHAVTVDDDAVYCLSDSKLWVYRITASGAVDTSSFSFSLQLCRTEPLPLCNAIVGRSRCFSVVPRLQRRTGHKPDGNSWFGGIVWSLFADPTPEWTVPRFLVLDQVNNAYLWDPETKIQTLIASDVSQISHWSPRDWPLLTSHVVGLYGRHGYHAWWPFLEGVAFAPPVHDDVVIQFLQANDPFRAKYVASSLSKTLTWESYAGLLAEYGVQVQVGGGVGVTSSMPMLLDPLLRFNPEVQILGIHAAFGVLVGAFQDNYTGVFDVSCRVQPFVHTTLCYLLLHHQTESAAAILNAIPRRCALTTLTQELVLVAILDKCYQTKWDVAVLEKALALLKDTDHDMETYCEIVANVARKVEPNRLPLLFPLAGDPTHLLQLCRQRNEVRTAANFLLCLDESVANDASSLRPRTNSYAQFQSRSALAFELLVDCCEKDQLPLALQVVRVARAWEPDHYRSNSQQYDRYIDEQVGKYAFQMLVQHRFDKVVWLLTQVEATLPTLNGEELGINDKNVQLIQTRLLALLTQAQLRKLHAGVLAARYEQWASLIKNLLDQSPARLNRLPSKS